MATDPATSAHVGTVGAGSAGGRGTSRRPDDVGRMGRSTVDRATARSGPTPTATATSVPPSAWLRQVSRYVLRSEVATAS